MIPPRCCCFSKGGHRKHATLLGRTFCWDHSSMNAVRHFQRGPGYWVWGAGVTGRGTVPTPQGLVLWPCHMNLWRYVPGVGQGDPLPWSVLKFQPSLLDASMHLFSESMVWTALLTFNLPILKVYNLYWNVYNIHKDYTQSIVIIK